MRIYFTKCNSLMSRTMRWMFEEPVSHVGLGFFEDTLKLAIDITTTGSHIQYRDAWLRKNEAVSALDLYLPIEVEHQWYHELCHKIIDTDVAISYDFGLYAFGLWQGVKRKVGLPYRTENNIWADDDSFACVEIFIPLLNEFDAWGIPMSSIDFDENTPWMLYNKLRAMKSEHGPIFRDVHKDELLRPQRIAYKRG